MNVEEIKEGAEEAHHKGEKGVGLTMAITAVLLAVATLLSHRAHTEEGLLQGKIVDEWDFYQAKHSRAHEYGAIAELAALLPNGKDLALKDYKKSLEEECGTPPEHGCSSPAKDSVLLRELMGPAPTEGSGKDDKTEDAAPPKAPEAKAHEEKSPEKHEGKSLEKHEGKESKAKPGATKIQEGARELEHEREIIERQANCYDGAELFLEISIVLCSIALLAEMKLFWKLSFITTALGVCVAILGLALNSLPPLFH
jgi:hypothetical protein